MNRYHFATIVGMMDCDENSEGSSVDSSPITPALNAFGFIKLGARAQRLAMKEGATIALSALYQDEKGNLIAVVKRTARKHSARLPICA